MSQVSLVPILLWLAALACAAVAVWQGPLPIDRSFVIDRLLRYLFLFPLGLLGLWAFIGHVFFDGQSAASIGWAPSPFQYEVGVANLGLGLASLYARLRSSPRGRHRRRMLPHRRGVRPYQGYCRGWQSCTRERTPDHGDKFSDAARHSRAALLREPKAATQVAGNARARGPSLRMPARRCANIATRSANS